ncbi:hypothetical protein FG379_000544 [Cryptosporidium bovis]|uniref:uncharacterized protein n=1 Tax=Cryptosporidium bovis TaxID=310047 RepID=UPI00351A77E7|nr:hypothetical protein FG379_000544 [Cryptosporidium bovis]
MIRGSEDIVYEYDPEKNNIRDENDENLMENESDSLKKSFVKSVQSNEQMINGNLVKTNYLKIIQALSENENVKMSRLKSSSITSDDLGGSLIRIKSDISEIEGVVKAYENIKKGAENAPDVNIAFLNDSSSFLADIEEIKMNLNSLIEKQKSLEESASSIDSLKDQKLSAKDVLEELSKCIKNNVTNSSEVTEEFQNSKQELEISLECVNANYDKNIDIKQLLDLERRVYELESRIGIDKLSNMPYNDIQAAIHNISQRLSLLDTNRLEGIFRRVQALSTSIEQLNKKRKEINDSLFNETDSTNITKLYDIIQKWKSTGATLPFILERLRLLKLFHQDISTINSRIAVMESQQEEAERVLETCKSSFAKLNDSIEKIYEKLKDKQ